MNATLLLVLASFALGALGVPLILKLVPPNPIYGFRTPSTMADRALWFRVNRFAGWALLVAGGVSASTLALAPEGAPGFKIGIFVVPLLVALAITGVYVSKTRASDG